jgi:hypothetical protein
LNKFSPYSTFRVAGLGASLICNAYAYAYAYAAAAFALAFSAILA